VALWLNLMTLIYIEKEAQRYPQR